MTGQRSSLFDSIFGDGERARRAEIEAQRQLAVAAGQLRIYEAALNEIACHGEVEAHPSARTARRALRDARGTR